MDNGFGCVDGRGDADLQDSERAGRIAFDLAYATKTGKWLKTAERPREKAGSPAVILSCREQIVGFTPTPDEQKRTREWYAKYAVWLGS